MNSEYPLPGHEVWQAEIEERVAALEDQAFLDALALNVAKSEAERIVTLCKAYVYRGPRDMKYMTKIETAALRIVHEVDNTNVRQESVQEVSPGMGLWQQGQEELRSQDTD